MLIKFKFNFKHVHEHCVEIFKKGKSESRHFKNKIKFNKSTVNPFGSETCTLTSQSI